MEAPPARANAATLPSAVRIRITLDRMANLLCDLSYQPLMMASGATLVPPRGLRVRKNTKTDLTRKSVGCTTRSTPTLSAQFRWGHQRVRGFLDAPYLRTSAGRTICVPLRTGQYGTLPMPSSTYQIPCRCITATTDGASDIPDWRRVYPELIPEHRRVVSVLLCSRGWRA
jgi:hypothetical protein